MKDLKKLVTFSVRIPEWMNSELERLVHEERRYPTKNAAIWNAIEELLHKHGVES